MKTGNIFRNGNSWQWVCIDVLSKTTNMKQLIFCAVFTIGMAGFASAQTSGAQGSRNTTQSSSTGTKAKTKNNTSSSAAKADTSNNRVEYKSKRTKQVATPTGQEATGTNGSHANNPKNAGKNDGDTNE